MRVVGDPSPARISWYKDTSHQKEGLIYIYHYIYPFTKNVPEKRSGRIIESTAFSILTVSVGKDPKTGAGNYLFTTSNSVGESKHSFLVLLSGRNPVITFVPFFFGHDFRFHMG
jgi:hypothetical protein